MFQFRDYLSNSYKINKLTTLFGVKDTLFCFKQLPLTSNLVLELFIHTTFGEGLSFAVKGGLTFSFDNPLNHHSKILFARLEKVVTVL